MHGVLHGLVAVQQEVHGVLDNHYKKSHIVFRRRSASSKLSTTFSVEKYDYFSKYKILPKYQILSKYVRKLPKITASYEFS